MQNNPDFKDLFLCLNDARARYLVVGAYVESKYDDQPIFLLSRDDLIRAKRAAGRPQDLLDVASLESSRKQKP